MALCFVAVAYVGLLLCGDGLMLAFRLVATALSWPLALWQSLLPYGNGLWWPFCHVPLWQRPIVAFCLYGNGPLWPFAFVATAYGGLLA